MAKPTAPAAERNAAAILDVLQTELRNARDVLEIGSGTGQHAVTIGAALPDLSWQTSDLDENHPAIVAWVDDAGLDNVHSPISLDVLTATLPAENYDAVFSANTAHIMGFAAVEKMFALVAHTLRDGGRFCLYGPFREQGAFSTESNAAFDQSLRSRDPSMGIRDLEQLDELAAAGKMRRVRRYAMPANNLLVVWQKGSGAG